MKNSILKKLKGRAGESLAETLIAVLVIAVASMLLASMITATTSIVKRSQSSMEKYYNQSSKLETLSDTNLKTASISITVSDMSDSNTYWTGSIPVQYEQNDELGRHTVIAYRIYDNSTGG